MKPKKLKYSSVFFKSLNKFPKEQLKLLQRQEKIFRENIFDSRLKTHKLSGRLAGFYAFSISYHWRIIFHLEGDKTVVFDNIGTHRIYK